MNTEPLNDCGCCEGVEAQTPAVIENRPGLKAIAYRCGTHAQFKQSMLAALSSAAHPALSALNTRDDNDFSIALLDAWATTSDVLTFYQERIAQESYLRTATERVSLLQLGRLIGYELRPGVAASTWLAFTLETAPGAPRSAIIDIGSKVQSVPGPNEKPQLFETVGKIEARPEWNAMKAQTLGPQQITASTVTVYFRGTGTNLKKGDALLFLDSGLPLNNESSWSLSRVKTVTLVPASDVTVVELESALTGFAPVAGGTVEVYALRHRSGMFGHNSPDPRLLPKDTRTDFGLGSDLEWDFAVEKDSVDLDAVYPAINAETWAVLLKPFLPRFSGHILSGPGPIVALMSDPQLRVLGRVKSNVEVGGRDYGLSAKVSRLALTKTASPGVTSFSEFGGQNLRQTSVFAQSDRLELALAPITTPVSGENFALANPVADLPAGRALAISGRKRGTSEMVSQIVTLTHAATAGESPVLAFTPPIPELERDSVIVNANVAPATHGETVSEIVGDGDASQAFQKFLLRQPPLTYVRAPSAGGAASTLQVRVNDLLWHEVPTFYGRGPAERIYTSTTTDDGTTVIQFGDGVTGARPPTGAQNIRATYRRGIGLEGLVKPDQLSLLLTRPLGVKGVSNPLAAAGAADREQLSDARRNAPLTVLTLDRIVSLQDYEDFVRAFAGIAKALATWTWDGEARGVFVTVAGPNGAEVEMSGDFGQQLLAAIQQASVPRVPIRVQSYRAGAGLFSVSGRVKIDPDFESETVLAGVRTALQKEFSFEAREFGDPVNLSEVIAVMQSVYGVVAVDVDDFRRVESPTTTVFPLARFSTLARLAALRSTVHLGKTLSAGSILVKRPRLPAPPPSRLVASVPQAGSGGAAIAPAELLVLAPLLPEQIGVMP